MHFAITNGGTRHVDSVSSSPLTSPQVLPRVQLANSIREFPPKSNPSKKSFETALFENKFLKGVWFDQFT